MQFPQNPHPHWAQNGRISTIRFHNLKYLEGNCMRNVSPADERRPQGLRAHIHTFTMRAFSDSSAKKSAQHTPISSISGTKLAQHTPTNTTPDTKLAQHEPHRATAVQNSPGTPPSSASPVQNSPSTSENTRFGRFSACRANAFTHVDRTGRAGEFLLRAQPPLRLGILPLTSTPPSWRHPSSAGKINIQPPTSAPTIRQ